MELTEELKQKILELCTDNLGLTSVMASELNLAPEQINELMETLIQKGLVTKEKELLKEWNPRGDNFWYELTKKGESICV